MIPNWLIGFHIAALLVTWYSFFNAMSIYNHNDKVSKQSPLDMKFPVTVVTVVTIIAAVTAFILRKVYSPDVVMSEVLGVISDAASMLYTVLIISLLILFNKLPKATSKTGKDLVSKIKFQTMGFAIAFPLGIGTDLLNYLISIA